MKRLFIIRHAKSSWRDSNLTDFDRPLNLRGQNDAPFMGEQLRLKEIRPDLILSSPAIRAKSTAQVIGGKLAYTEEIVFDRDIYEATLNTLLTVVNNIDNEYETVFLFGHNPGFTHLVEYLSNEIIGNLPTCGVVGIAFDFDDWAMISSNTGNVFLYDYPKKYQ